MSYVDDRRIFVEALRPIEAALNDIILVGGWAHRLHAHSPLAAVEVSTLRTLDADLFIPAPSPSTAIRLEALRRAGFGIHLRGLSSTPVTEYVLKGPNYEFELEFLAHRHGGEIDRRGSRRDPVPVGEAVAILLPFMDVMRHEPWTCVLDEARGYPVGPEPIRLQVVSPAPYVAHKLMVLKDRQPAIKRHQDVRYLYETIRRFAPALSELRASWSRRTSTTGELKRVAAGRRFLASGTLIAAAAQTPDLDGLTADEQHMRVVLAAGLDEIFGPLPR